MEYTKKDFESIQGKKVKIIKCRVDNKLIEKGLYTITDFITDGRVCTGRDDYPTNYYSGTVIYLQEKKWFIPFTSEFVKLNKQLEFDF